MALWNTCDMFYLFVKIQNYLLNEERKEKAKTLAKLINFSRMLINKQTFHSFLRHFSKRAREFLAFSGYLGDKHSAILATPV